VFSHIVKVLISLLGIGGRFEEYLRSAGALGEKVYAFCYHRVNQDSHFKQAHIGLEWPGGERKLFYTNFGTNVRARISEHVLWVFWEQIAHGL
jgi:hypothetical protein